MCYVISSTFNVFKFSDSRPFKGSYSVRLRLFKGPGTLGSSFTETSELQIFSYQTLNL